jgi:putative ABC transport system substrate-binding protein
MRRREFITLLGGAAAWPLAVRAQQPKVWRIGVLAPVPPTPAMLSAFRDGMRGRGYIEGQNLSIDVRWPQGTFDQDRNVVTELVNNNVDVIVAWATAATDSDYPAPCLYFAGGPWSPDVMPPRL